jgi:hypothetical protein
MLGCILSHFREKLKSDSLDGEKKTPAAHLLDAASGGSTLLPI